MRTISTAELRRKAGQVLKQLKADGQLFITNEGKVVALLIPLSLDTLHPPSQPESPPTPRLAPKPTAPESKLLTLKELNSKFNSSSPKSFSRPAQPQQEGPRGAPRPSRERRRTPRSRRPPSGPPDRAHQ